MENLKNSVVLNMNLQLGVWSLILLLGAIQGFILSFVIFFQKKGSLTSNRIFATLILILTIIQIDHSLRLSDFYQQFPNMIYISDSVWYLIGPLLLFYLKFQINDIQKFHFYDALHLIPFLVIAYLYRNLFAASADLKIQILEAYKASGGQYQLSVKLLILFMMIQMLGYISYSLFLIKRYEMRFKEIFSNNHIQYLTGLKLVFFFFLTYFIFEFSFSTYRNFVGIQNKALENWSLVVWVLFIYALAFLILKHPNLIFPQILPYKKLNPQFENADTDKKEIELLLTLMEAEKPYLDSELKLPDLAEKLNSSIHRVSYLINKKLKVNFYEFINTYRIKEAKEKLGKPEYQHLTISGIAQETGFKSKASFYKFFRKEFGMTPTEYLAKKTKK